MESYSKAKRNVSVVENLEDRVTSDHAMRMLTVAWIIPAIALLTLGLSAVTDSSFLEATNQVERLHQVRAGVVLLSILTVLVGAIWALRSWDLLPNLSSIEQDNWRFGLRFHALALVVAAFACATAPFAEGFAIGSELILWWVAAVAACLGGAMLPRWLRQIGDFSSQSIAVFACVVVYQLTIGWLHMATLTTVGSVVLVAEGSVMAIVSIVAAFTVPAFGRRHLRIADEPNLEEVLVEIFIPKSEEVTQELAQRPVEEPAVVR